MTTTKPIIAKVVVLDANKVAVRLLPVQGNELQPGESLLLLSLNTPVKHGDIWDGSKLVENPDAAELAIAKTKKLEFMAQLKSITSLDELKTAAASIDAAAKAL